MHPKVDESNIEIDDSEIQQQEILPDHAPEIRPERLLDSRNNYRKRKIDNRHSLHAL